MFRFSRISIFLILLATLLFLPACKQENAGTESSVPKTENSAAVAGEIRKEYERGPIRVRLLIDKDSVSIAENLTLTLEADVKEGYEVDLPAFGDKLGQFGIVDYHEEPPKLTGEGRILTKKVYELEPFLSGDYKIAPMKVTFWEKSSQGKNQEAPEKHEIETGEVTVKVRSLLGDDRSQLQVKPIFGPVNLPVQLFSRMYLLIGAAFLLIVAGSALFFRHQRRRRQNGGDLVNIPAHELAYREIQKILDEQLLDRGEIKLFYARICDVVRHYIENRFGLHAPKHTTEEFLGEISMNSVFAPDHQRLLDDFLHHCDLVKFAEYQPTPEEIQKTFDACKAFIEATKVENGAPAGKPKQAA